MTFEVNQITLVVNINGLLVTQGFTFNLSPKSSTMAPITGIDGPVERLLFQGKGDKLMSNSMGKLFQNLAISEVIISGF